MKEKMDNLKYYLSALADIALPRCCIVCGRQLGTRESHLCLYCSADFPFTRFWISPRNAMSDRLNLALSRAMEKHQESLAYEKYSYAIALFYYHGEAAYKKIPQGLKYRKQFGEGRYFSRLLAEKTFSCRWFSDVDMLIPVPLHWKRKWERGYNQAELLARELGRGLGIPVRKLLGRKTFTAVQKNLGYAARQRNEAGAFFALSPPVAEKRLILVDDVYTTGATAENCTRALLRAGAEEVWLLAMASVKRQA